MIVYPAIDLRAGKVVRLQEGDPSRQTIFSDNPVAVAKNWIEQGASWIHLINLDGALALANGNSLILDQVARLDVKVQFGGGIRTIEDIKRALTSGASRVILGTVAVQQPDIVSEAIDRWGTDMICVALDAKDGKITTHGWQETSDLSPADFGQQMVERGVRHALYTDVSRDGKLIGADIEGTIALGRDTGLEVIASGGVSQLDEIHRLAESRTVAGVIIGMALYTGRLSLEEALLAAGGERAG